MKIIKEYYKKEFAKPFGKLAFMCRFSLYLIAVSKIILHNGFQIISYSFLLAIFLSFHNLICVQYQEMLDYKNEELVNHFKMIISLKEELYKYKEEYGELKKIDENY